MEWKRGSAIGRGSSAVVSLATTAAGGIFALKSADAVSSRLLLQEEEFVISQLNSPFVVKCLGSEVTREGDAEVFNLFLEYVPGGTLSDLVRSQGGALDEIEIRFYAHQLVQGLNYLHRKGLAHLDIKGQNVLIGDEGLKIADFGCAKWMREGAAEVGGFAGTPAYMAPEVVRGEEQGFPADIWALGCTVIEMATGSNPWPEMKDPAAALYRVGYTEDLPEFPSWLSEDARDFLGKCLVREAAERWTAAELLQHPFFTNCGEIREVARKSPTSVLVQCFWDAMEVSDSDSSSQNPSAVVSSSDSPAVRIVGLLHNLNSPDWGEEEEWVTVRGDEREEYSSRVHYDIEDLNFENSIGSSIVIEEDSFLNCFSDEISVSLDGVRKFSSHGVGDDSVSRNVVEFSFSQLNRLLLQSFSPFLLSLDGIILHASNQMEATNSPILKMEKKRKRSRIIYGVRHLKGVWKF